MSRPRIALFATGGVLLLAVAVFLGSQRAHGPRYGTKDRTAIAAFQRGDDEIRRFRFPSAVQALREAVQADPDFALAHCELAHALDAVGATEQASAALAIADSLARAGVGVTEFEALRILHVSALAAENQAEAAHYYDLLQRDHADEPYAVELRARRARAEEKLAEAEAIYRALLADHPERVDVHNDIGYLALEQGHYDDAVASFQRYVYYAGDSANPHDSLGEAFLWTGRYHESWQEYLRALEIDPTYVSSVMGACDALALTGQFRRALELLQTTRQVFEERGALATFEVKRLQLTHAAERWADVVARSDELMQDPTFTKSANPGHRLWIRSLRAIALAETGDLTASAAERVEVENAIAELLEQIPSTATEPREDLVLLRASIRTRLSVLSGERVSESLAELGGLLDTSTRKPHRLLAFRSILVEALVDAGLHREAIAAAAPILAFNPRYPDANLALARAHLELRDRESALAHLQTYVDMMERADEDVPDVQLARRLVTKLVPSS